MREGRRRGTSGKPRSLSWVILLFGHSTQPLTRFFINNIEGSESQSYRHIPPAGGGSLRAFRPAGTTVLLIRAQVQTTRNRGPVDPDLVHGQAGGNDGRSLNWGEFARERRTTVPRAAARVLPGTRALESRTP